VRVEWGDYLGATRPYLGALEDTGAIEYTTQSGDANTPWFELVIVTISGGATVPEGMVPTCYVSRTGSTSYPRTISFTANTGTAQYGPLGDFSKDFSIYDASGYLNLAITVPSGSSSRTASVPIWEDGISGESNYTDESAIITLTSPLGSGYEARSTAKTATIFIQAN
jgi:hypothetical protein